MKAPFKAGEKVRLVDASGLPGREIREGSLFVVAKVRPSLTHPRQLMVELRGKVGGYFIHRFARVKPPATVRCSECGHTWKRRAKR